VALFAAVGVLAISPLLLRLTPIDADRLPSCVQVVSPSGEQTFLTYRTTLITALDDEEIPLGSEDRLNLPADFPLQAGDRYLVQIDDLHSVRLSWNGIVLTATASDGPILALANLAGYADVPVMGRDRIEATPTDGVVEDGAEIAYITVRSEFVATQEAVPFKTLYVDDPAYRIGYSAVVQTGKSGLREITYEEIYEDDLLHERNAVKTEIVKNPVSKIIRRGSSTSVTLGLRRDWATRVSRRYKAIAPMLVRNGSYNYQAFTDNDDGTITVDGRTFSVLSEERHSITAYDAVEWYVVSHGGIANFPAGTSIPEGPTFSGIPARRGIVATYAFRESDRWVATRLPMGTVLFIERYGLAVVGDIHHVTHDIDRLDLAYDPREVLDGYRLGLTNRRVYIIDFPVQ
jgi:3D (Asp-Asp-Asp) domain-containing protein